MTTERNQKRTKHPWSRGDRMLVIISGLLAAMAVGLLLWLRAADTLPALLPPPHPMPAVNARNYYIAATNALVDTNKIDAAVSKVVSPGTPVYSLTAKAKLVSENARAISLLHQGFQYPYAEPPVRSFSAGSPFYQTVRRLARFLSLEGQVKAAQADWAGAVNADIDAVQLGETLPRGADVIGMMAGKACQAIGRKQVWQAAPHLSAAEARAAARRLEAVRTAHVPFADSLQEEEWETQASLRELMTHPDWASQIILTMGARRQSFVQNPKEWTQNTIGTAIVEFTGKRKILTDYATSMDRGIVRARQPYAAPLAPLPLPNDALNQILVPPMLGLRYLEVDTDTQNALLVTVLALQAYRQDHGAYPATLAALVPGYLKAVPTDPFALSGPLRYKLAGAKYVLYSVGPDGKDDGGKAIFDATKPVPSPGSTNDPRRWVLQDSQGDVVARVNIN